MKYDTLFNDLVATVRHKMRKISEKAAWGIQMINRDVRRYESNKKIH